MKWFKSLVRDIKNYCKTKKSLERENKRLRKLNEKNLREFSVLVKLLLRAVEDNVLTATELTELRRHAYEMLLKHGFDQEKKKGK